MMIYYFDIHYSVFDILRFKRIVRFTLGPAHHQSDITFPLDNRMELFYNYLN